jgi:hypothetical protein
VVGRGEVQAGSTALQFRIAHILMKVRCINIDPEQFPISREQKDIFNATFGRGEKLKLFDHVEVSKEYVVYAMTTRRGFPYYYVSWKGRADDWFFTPALCFEIIDDRPSTLWHVGIRSFPDGTLPITTFAIKQWIDEPMFLENLVDCRERELKIMTAAARAMDAEYDAAPNVP